MLTMFMSGLFLSALREDGAVQDTACATAEKPAANFISVLLIIFALIGTIAFAYALTVRLAAGTYFQKALIESGATGGIDKAEASLARALSLAPSDSYYKALSELQLSRVSEVLADQKMSKTDAQKAFQDRLSLAIQAANQAVALDPSNYSNFMSLGAIFESVIPLKIEGAYEGAKQAYEQALKLNPLNPEIYLGLARLDVAKGDNTAARANIGKALEKKGDYASAIYLLAQIQIGERNVPEAIRSVEAVAQLSPTDAGIFFQLGLLYYDQRQYQNAVLAFGRAVTINPQYANAKYLLGLAFYEVKDTASALDQFRQLEVTNPDNAEIKAIITNLESGKAPLAPVTAKGKLPVLPVKETTVREGI
jgi:tetratricopeptide (TPR) repeat protein